MEVVCHETTQSTYQLSVTTTFGHTLDTAQYIFFHVAFSKNDCFFTMADLWLREAFDCARYFIATIRLDDDG